jgi:hypothetical protein
VARWIADVIVRKKDVGDEVSEYRSRFNVMQYCLTPQEVARVAPALFESVFADEGSYRLFVKALG